MSERLMTLADLADMLGLPITTLYQWRHRGEGPPATGSAGMFVIGGPTWKRGWKRRRTTTGARVGSDRGLD